MKKFVSILILILPFALFANTDSLPKGFEKYKDGDEKLILSDARNWAMKGLNSEEVRVKKSSILRQFILSQASDEAKSLALGWLGVVGGAAAIKEIEPSLPDALKERARDVLDTLTPVYSPTILEVKKNKYSEVELKEALKGDASQAALALGYLACCYPDTNIETFLTVWRDSQPLKVSAEKAILLVNRAFAKAYFAKKLDSKDVLEEAEALHFLSLLNAFESKESVLKIALDGTSKNSQNAKLAYANIAEEKDFAGVLKFWSKDSSWQGAAWVLARRINVENAKTQLFAAQLWADENFAEKLKSMSMRLFVPQLEQGVAPQEPQVSSIQDRGIIYPDNFLEVAYLNCGAEKSSAKGKVKIESLRGKSFPSGSGVSAYDTVEFDDKKLAYEISGLDDNADYVLGISWFDFDKAGRLQNLKANGIELISAVPLNAYYKNEIAPSRLQFALSKGVLKDGKLLIEIEKLGKTNVVANEIWLLKRNVDGGKKILLISGDDYKGHFWRETQAEIARILREEKFELSIVESPHILLSDCIKNYDAIILHFKNYEDRIRTNEKHWKNLKSFVNNGGGLMLTHFACGAMQEWHEFIDICGGVWNKKGHDPYGVFTVIVKDKNHPISVNMSDFKIEDELYTCLNFNDKISAIFTAVSVVDSKEYPQAFVMEYGKGKVYNCTLGHSVNSYKNAHLRTLTKNAAHWVCK